MSQSSECKIINGSKNLIVCFGGMALKIGDILPFEFLNFLSSNYREKADAIFYIDKNRCYYNKGIQGISSNIDETSEYLKTIILGYEKVIFMGVSSGGYASILFGSLCNISNVIAFIPLTLLDSNFEENYKDLKPLINSETDYKLIGDKNCHDIYHSVEYCDRLDCFPNLKVIKFDHFDMKELRDSGFINQLLDEILL